MKLIFICYSMHTFNFVTSFAYIVDILNIVPQCGVNIYLSSDNHHSFFWLLIDETIERIFQSLINLIKHSYIFIFRILPILLYQCFQAEVNLLEVPFINSYINFRQKHLFGTSIYKKTTL